MTSPTFNGASIFGIAPIMNTTTNPAAIQTNAYPQVNGVEIVNLGSRGRTTEVRGYFGAPDLPTLAALSAVWRNLAETATVATLVATDGTVYPYAYVGRFVEADRIMVTGGGALLRQYQATFLHIV